MSTKGQYILTGIEKRLTPSPIATLTSSVSTGFNSKYSPGPAEDRRGPVDDRRRMR